MDELQLLHLGVRFTPGTTPARTSSGHAYPAPVLRASGPDKPEVIQALREAVEARMPAMRDPEATRGARRGQPGCDYCGGPVCTIVRRPDGTQAVRVDVSTGGCSLCALARQKIKAEEEKRAA